MNKEFLSRLYWMCTDQNHHPELGMNLMELYERMESTENAEQAFSNKLYATALDFETMSQLEYLNSDSCLAYEQQGFMNGFRLGMKLAKELSGEETSAECERTLGKLDELMDTCENIRKRCKATGYDRDPVMELFLAVLRLTATAREVKRS